MKLRLLKIAIWVGALTPLVQLGVKAFHGNLGANPIELITHTTGDWTLILLLATLSVMPLRMLSKQFWLIGARRLLGLFAFFYACLHFTTYIWLDKFFDLHEIWADVLKRKFITVGFLAFLLLIPLAATSTAGWIRRLGGKRWQRLHQLIYVSAIAGVVHYIWLVKADLRKPLEYAVVLSALLGYRLWARAREAAARTDVQERTPLSTVGS